MKDRTTLDYSKRSTGNRSFYKAVLTMMDDSSLPASTGLFVICARKRIEHLYGKGSSLKIVAIEDYDSFNYFDNRHTTMANIRFMDAATGRYRAEWVTILNLTDQDYKDLLLERI